MSDLVDQTPMNVAPEALDEAPERVADEKKAAARRASLKPLAALRPYVLRYRGMVAATLVAVAAAAMATLAVPLAVRRMIDLGFSTANAAFVDKYFAMMLLVGVVLAIASAARFYYVNWLGERVVADLRADVFQHLARLSPAFYESTRSGEVMSRLTADTTQIKVAIGTAASQTLRNLVLFLGALVMMFVTSVKLSALVLVAIPVVILPLVAYGRLVKRLSRRAQDTLAEASAYAAENLSAVRTMQAFTSEGRVVRRFSDAIEQSFEAARARMKARAGLTVIAISLVFVSIIGILWFGASDVLRGTMTGGRLGQFVLYAVFAAGALGELSEVWGEVQQAAGSAERLSELMHVRSDIVSPGKPIAFPVEAAGEIVFDNVSFAYPSRPEIPAVENVSFTTRPGETLAIVGPSGAGKSTIFGLILRFYDPQSGEVRIDGVPICKADLAALRQRIALVSQEVALFAETVAENIRYGAPEASRADIEAAAKAALADEFIRALPQGYDTRLSERGVTLSGGQRQRIAIARATLRDAPILLLDEATSALDAESEKTVQEALEYAMKARTTLVIAHRLATVQRADRILVIEKGRIVEEGTHKSLIGNDGIYKRLAALQFAVDATV